MKIIVTGSAGFIGSHLCERLVALGHDVTGIDNFETGRIENLHCPNNNWDISSYPLKHGCRADWIFHLAALADIVPSIERPWRYHQVNTHGTVRLLEWARRSNVKRFTYVASSSCYGIPKELPTPESAEIDCRYPYALTKYMGECAVLHYARVYGIGANSCRLANVYGPRSRTTGAYGAVFGTFMAQIANGQPVTVVGDGTQRRDFVHVSDVVTALIRVAESDKAGQAFNVGADESQSVNRLIELLGGRSRAVLPWRPGEPRNTLLDISKIYRELDWYPKTSFDAGVAEMRELIPQFKSAPLWNPDSIATATRSWFQHLEKSV